MHTSTLYPSRVWGHASEMLVICTFSASLTWMKPVLMSFTLFLSQSMAYISRHCLVKNDSCSSTVDMHCCQILLDESSVNISDISHLSYYCSYVSDISMWGKSFLKGMTAIKRFQWDIKYVLIRINFPIRGEQWFKM